MSELDPSRMFFDYSPWPANLICVDKSRQRWDVVIPPPLLSVMWPPPEYPEYENSRIDIESISLNQYVYPIEDILYKGSLSNVRKYYGWGPKTRTIVTYDPRTLTT